MQSKNLDMAGKVCLVTGATAGIGQATALLLAKVFENTPDFWLNLQRRNDIWKIMHNPKRKARIEKARPLREAFA